MTGNDAALDAHATAPPAGELEARGHGHGDHSADGGHDAAHAQEPLGPIDWRAWGAGVLGAVAAGVVALALYIASHPG